MHRHLNNVAQARYYEEGLARFHRALQAQYWEDGLSVVGELRIRYLAEGSYPEALILYGGVYKIGRSSYAFEQALWQGSNQLSYCQTMSVYCRRGASSTIPPAVRDHLVHHLLRPFREIHA